MARSGSPRFNGDHLYDPSFTAEITAKMQVPKRIKVGGNHGDEDDDYTSHITWQPEKIDMRVPDRILVAGQDKHIGTPAPPRELIIENTVMPPDPGLIRVQTPPRVITLDEHYFPSAADHYENECESHADMNAYNENNLYRDMDNSQSNFMMDQSLKRCDLSTTVLNSGPFLKTEEEVLHLRKQVSKLNRRVVHIEHEIGSLQQREKLIFGVATVFIIMKFFSWISRNN